jgi:hypothetical protein
MTKKAIEEQELFLRLSNPNTFRRNLLESSKLILTILKQTYRVKQIREAKHERMERLAKEIKELRILIQKIDELMPNYSKTDLKKLLPEINFTPIRRPEPALEPLLQQAPAKDEIKPQPKPQPKAKPQLSAQVSDFDKITKALEDVQRKLQNL